VLDRQYDAGLVTVWCKGLSCVVFLALIAVLRLGWLLTRNFRTLARVGQCPPVGFFALCILNAVLEGTAVLLYLRALQVSPISYCIPFLALTPLFLLPTGIFFLHERVSGGMVIGCSSSSSALW